MKPFKDYTVSTSKPRPLQEQMDEVRRELDVRRRIYDSWTRDGKVSWTEAHDRLERLLSALATLIKASEQEASNVEQPEFTAQSNVAG